MVADDYGIFSLIIGTLTGLSTFLAAGASVTTNTVFARNDYSESFKKNAFWMSIYFLAALLCIIVLVAYPWLSNEMPSSVLPFFVITLFIIAFNGVFEGALYGRGAYKKLFISGVIAFLLSLPVIVILIKEFNVLGGVAAILFYRLLLSVLLSIMVCKTESGLFNKLSFKFNHSVVPIFYKMSLPSILAGLLVAPVITVILYIIKYQSNGQVEVGYFNWVYQLYIVAIFIPSSLTGYFISKLVSDGQCSLKKLTLINVLFATFVAILAIVMKPILLGIAGEEFNTHATELFYWMCLAVVLYSLNCAYGSFWPSIDKAWIGLFMNLVWAMILLSIVYTKIDEYGIAVIGIAFCVSYLSIWLIQIVISKRIAKV
ncbi:hypothetical protein CWB73_02140 [Pseudoalteromonas phenolica]|uniref:Polysaccharide biosynthesis protein n=1 Tax=Pseudoalteromonas phenolica TaxID=161398 RepID=A0A5S3YZR8_9GAMM|nr:hypothetical protein [Pseudoalteromonas phenolica]TMP83642.1 hypothetical protein CWB73_02140 [Pseudoalteromonas phenolica]